MKKSIRGINKNKKRIPELQERRWQRFRAKSIVGNSFSNDSFDKIGYDSPIDKSKYEFYFGEYCFKK